ncbi:MAG: HNH endonuclease [Candidatus Izemoplasmatales bacterium]
MSINDKTRKILWAKAGNQCAICKQKLVLDLGEKNTVVGEECHIISPMPNGPRHLKIEKYNEYENLILLCSVHHKLVDDNEETFTEGALKTLKRNHELNIGKKNAVNAGEIILLTRATTTRELVRCLHEAMAFSTDYPIERKEDYDLFAEFIGLVNDSDVLNDFDEFTRMKYFENPFNEILKKGYYVLIGRVAECGKYKLDTAFAYIVTKEEFERNSFST